MLRTDQGASGYSAGDNLFDTKEQGRGADHAFPFHIESLKTRDPNARVTAQVDDGSMQMVLTFENFYAGDSLHFSIDVDEVQHLYSLDDIAKFNDGLDPITSGAEFEGSALQAEFSAPNYEDASASGSFLNRYDAILAQATQSGNGLDLPADNANGQRDRTAGAAATTMQKWIPASKIGRAHV